jgi:hypothetical protein
MRRQGKSQLPFALLLIPRSTAIAPARKLLTLSYDAETENVSNPFPGTVSLSVAAIRPDRGWHEEPQAQQLLLAPRRSIRYTENV